MEMEPRGASVDEHLDRFANCVHSFDVLDQHSELVVTARSEVWTPERYEDDEPPSPLDRWDLLRESRYVPLDGSVAELAGEVAADGDGHATALALVTAVRAVDDLRARHDERAHARRRGACRRPRRLPGLRARPDRRVPRHGVPARYVSGYLFDPRERQRRGRVARVDGRVRRGAEAGSRSTRRTTASRPSATSASASAATTRTCRRRAASTAGRRRGARSLGADPRALTWHPVDAWTVAQPARRRRRRARDRRARRRLRPGGSRRGAGRGARRRGGRRCRAVRLLRRQHHRVGVEGLPGTATSRRSRRAGSAASSRTRAQAMGAAVPEPVALLRARLRGLQGRRRPARRGGGRPRRCSTACSSRRCMDGDPVAGVITESKAGREAILARRVIDATGDADVAHRAGAPTVKTPGEEMMAASVMFHARGRRQDGASSPASRATPRPTPTGPARRVGDRDRRQGGRPLLAVPRASRSAQAIADGRDPADLTTIGGTWGAVHDTGRAHLHEPGPPRGCDGTDPDV